MRPLSSFSRARLPLPCPFQGALYSRLAHCPMRTARQPHPLRGHSQRSRAARAPTALRRFTARAIGIHERQRTLQPQPPPRGGASLISPVPDHSRPWQAVGPLASAPAAPRVSLAPPSQPRGGGVASAMSLRPGGTLARVVLACLPLSRSLRSRLLQQAADAPRRPPICRRIAILPALPRPSRAPPPAGRPSAGQPSAEPNPFGSGKTVGVHVSDRKSSNSNERSMISEGAS